MPWYAWLVVGWICAGALFLSGWIAGASVVRASVLQESTRRPAPRAAEHGEFRLEDVPS
jgi:hypothetical protein